MLRKGIVALMISVMSVSGLQAADGKNSNTLLGMFRGSTNGRTQQRAERPRPSGGVTHAVVEDVDRQVPEIRQTSAQPPKPALLPAATVPQPTPAPYTPPTSDSQGQRTFHTASQTNSDGGVPLPPVNSGDASDAIHTVGFPGHLPPQGHHVLPLSRHIDLHGHHLPNGGYLPGMSGSPAAGPLYPAPKPGIPHQVGGTAFVHQAFHPHEMLYAHRYKSMYGPYYYKVDGGWILTPFGIWSKENWKLQGTTVDVKYKSHISPFTLFHRPIVR